MKKYWTNALMTKEQNALCRMTTTPVYLAADVEQVLESLKRNPFDTFETCKHGGINVIHWHHRPYCGSCLAEYADEATRLLERLR